MKNHFIKNPDYKQAFLFLSLGLTKNEGIAFGIPANMFFLKLVGFIFIILLLGYFLRLKDQYAKITLFLILAAALSNFLDRVLYHGVIDYIELPKIFVFNIADIMITLGALLILLTYFKQKNSTLKSSRS